MNLNPEWFCKSLQGFFHLLISLSKLQEIFICERLGSVTIQIVPGPTVFSYLKIGRCLTVINCCLLSEAVLTAIRIIQKLLISFFSEMAFIYW